MLRLLRRVREQTEGELPPGTLGLTPDDLSVIYVESGVDSVRLPAAPHRARRRIHGSLATWLLRRACRGALLVLSEYAVEPAAIGADWTTFKDLIDRFGADKGRLISRLPKKWEKKVIQAAKDSDVPDVRMKSIVERLHGAKYKVVHSNRAYDHEADWIDNALREHAKRSFRAIICNDVANACMEALSPDDCFDDHPLFNAPISQDVARTPDDIAGALVLLAAVAQEIDIVDPYFDPRPGKDDYIGPLRSLLTGLSSLAATPKVIRVHFGTHDSRPPSEILARDAPAQTKGNYMRECPR